MPCRCHILRKSGGPVSSRQPWHQKEDSQMQLALPIFSNFCNRSWCELPGFSSWDMDIHCWTHKTLLTKSRQGKILWFDAFVARLWRSRSGRSPNSKRVKRQFLLLFMLRKKRSKATWTILHYRSLAQNQVNAQTVICNHHSRKHAQGECLHKLPVRPGLWRPPSANHPSNISRKEFDKSQFIHKNVNPSSAPDTLLSMHLLLDVDRRFWISGAYPIEQ